MNQGFPKKSRLLKASDFSPVFDNPSFRVSNRCLLMLALKKENNNSRLGIVIAKKNIKTAVQRNRLKRLLRESFRIKSPDFGTIDLVVLVRKGLDALENKEIRLQIDSLFSELARKSNNQQEGEN